MSQATLTPLGIDTLLTPDGLLADRDGDGLPDALRACLVLGAASGWPEHAALLDVAARLAFESMALNLPLACTDASMVPPGGVPLFVGRPGHLPPGCPPELAASLARLQPGDGIVAVSNSGDGAVLIGGADAEGLIAATRLLTVGLQPSSSGVPAAQRHEMGAIISEQTAAEMNNPRPQSPSAAMRPRSQAGVESQAGAEGNLATLCHEVGAALGGLGLTVVAGAALTRASRLTGLRWHVIDGAAPREDIQGALTAAANGAGDGDASPCAVVVALPGEASDGAVQVQWPGIRVEPASASPETAQAHGQRPGLSSLAALYGPEGFALDADGDLLPEVPRTRIQLPDDLSPAEAVEAIHLAARLGLESLGLALPLAWSTGDESGSPAGADAADILIAVAPLHDRHSAHLSPGEGELRLDHGENGRAVLRVVGGDAHGRAAALAALARLDPWTQTNEEPTLAEVERVLGRLHALADPEARVAAALPALYDLPAQAVAASSAPLRLAVRSWAAAAGGAEALDQERAAQCLAGWARGHWPGVEVEAQVATPAAAPLLDETWPLSWEVDEVWARFEGEVVPALTALPRQGHDWLLDVRVSEPEGRRRQLKRELLEALRAAGLEAAEARVRVLPAYRQGRAWLLEEVAPLLSGRDVAALTVRVRRFECDGPCLELPIRWLQDLHPVDELIEERLGLSRGAVRFELSDGPSTYEVEARDARGDLVWQGRFDVVYGARPYLPGFPAWGQVHPPTGCVRLLVAGAAVVDVRVAPDPERAWDRVQEGLLPLLRRHIEAVTDGAPRPERQPFFGSLTIDAWLSEEDAALGLREEWSSPLESLHEDLYFMLLDYCSALMSADAGDGEPYQPPWVRTPDAAAAGRGARLWTAPGLVVPRIHQRDGAAGRVRVQITPAADVPELAWSRGAESGAVPLRAATEVSPRVVGMRLAPTAEVEATPANDTVPAARRLLIALDGDAEAREQARRILLGWNDLRAAGTLAEPAIPPSWALTIIEDGDGLTLDRADVESRDASKAAGDMPAAGSGVNGSAASTDPGAEVAAGVIGSSALVTPLGEEGARGGASAGARVPWDRVLGQAEIEAELGALARSSRAHVYQAGRSAQGRPSYAVELTVPRGEGLWSRAKLSGWKCTLLLNARHHGNEPSSTSALLRLAELLAFDAEWRRYLDRVNVVLIPCENLDGAALAAEMQDEHPTWMLHAGRYNAAGLEFTAEYSKPHTPHTEALVLPALWRRWAPDIVCDDHGFPSHEWAQPFAGHGNPWFRSHWIAQGLIYLIMPRLTNPRYERHARASEEVRRRLVRALADDARVRARNSAYIDRYNTYLSAWLPDDFPAPVEDDVLVHTFDYDPDDREQARASLAGPAGPYPGVTTVNLVTEVADETAQGRYMDLCAHTHLLADRALLEYLYDANAPAAVEREQHRFPSGRVMLRAVRPRPL